MENKILIEFLQSVEKNVDSTNKVVEEMINTYKSVIKKSDEEKTEILSTLSSKKEKEIYATLIAILDSSENCKEMFQNYKESFGAILLHIKSINRVYQKVKTFIPINIWDDFYEDGYVPEGKVQSTYAYVEDYDLTDDERYTALKNFFDYLLDKELVKSEKIKLVYNDTKNKYDADTVKRCIEQYGESFFFKRWEVQFTNYSHAELETLLEALDKSAIVSGESLLEIYSES